MKNHIKHPPLVRPKSGKFARHELAVLGTTCHAVESITAMAMKVLRPAYRIGYYDAAHEMVDDNHSRGLCQGSALLTDCVKFFRREDRDLPNEFDLKFANQSLDLLLVNGNHFAANQQLIVIDSAKETSLRKRMDQITDPVLILCNRECQVFDFVQAKLQELGKSPKVIDPNDEAVLSDWWLEFMNQKVAPLRALILIGGKSMRMGQNKAELNIHGISQTEYLADLCRSLSLPYTISVKDNTSTELGDYLPDRFLDLGPYGAILSAFMREPDVAWLVLACDMPGVNQDCLKYLIHNRNPSNFATVFREENGTHPNPFPGIYEPKIYLRLLQFLALGYSCPRKVLINSEVQVLEPESPLWLFNLNTPADLEAWNLRNSVVN